MMSDAGINWSDLDVMSDAGVNWADIDVLSRTGINWSDFEVMSDAGHEPHPTIWTRPRQSLILTGLKQETQGVTLFIITAYF